MRRSAAAEYQSDSETSTVSVFSNASKSAQKTESQQTAHLAILEFERSMKNLSHGYCHNCREVSLNSGVNKEKNLCKKCRKKDAINYLEQNLQPVYYDGMKNPIYNLPEEITGLRMAEVMLIQQASPYVPVQHINNGTFGLKGHVCMFSQDISEIVTVLPRLPCQVKMVRMVHTYKDSIGSTHNKIFTVRRKAVVSALKWLQKHNPLYRNIVIRLDNLQ